MPPFPAPNIGGRIVLRENMENINGGQGNPADLVRPYVDLDYEPLIDALMRGLTGINTEQLEVGGNEAKTEGLLFTRDAAGVLLCAECDGDFTTIAFQDGTDPSALHLVAYQSDETGALSNTGALLVRPGDGTEGRATVQLRRVEMEPIPAVHSGIQNGAWFTLIEGGGGLSAQPYFRDGAGVDHNLLDDNSSVGARWVEVVDDNIQLLDTRVAGSVLAIIEPGVTVALPRHANVDDGWFVDIKDRDAQAADTPHQVSVHGDDVGGVDIDGEPTFDLTEPRGAVRIQKTEATWSVMFLGQSEFPSDLAAVFTLAVNTTLSSGTDTGNIYAMTTGGLTVQLPAHSQVPTGWSVTFKDADGNAAGSPSTITRNVTDTELIDGASTFAIDDDYETVTFMREATRWMVL